MARYGKREIRFDPVMSSTKRPFEPPSPVSPTETATYISDILANLRKIASGQGQNVLVHLLDLARFEARSLTRDSLPGDQG
jgi:hypothetical protein